MIITKAKDEARIKNLEHQLEQRDMLIASLQPNVKGSKTSIEPTRNESMESEAKSFDFEAINKFCPFPILDPTLEQYVCSNKDCPIRLPKNRILTTHTCTLCYETQQAQSIHKDTVNSNRTIKKTLEASSDSLYQQYRKDFKSQTSIEDLPDKLARELFIKAMSGQDPFKDVPCPYECRMCDKNMQRFYCGKGMKPPFTDNIIQHRQIYLVDRCRQCIRNHHKAEELKALVRAKSQTRDYSGPRVIFPHDTVHPLAYREW